MLKAPLEIKVDEPVEVSRSEYNFIITRLSGLVFHRTDDEGRCWVKAVNKRACDYLMKIFEQSRPE